MLKKPRQRMPIETKAARRCERASASSKPRHRRGRPDRPDRTDPSRDLLDEIASQISGVIYQRIEHADGHAAHAYVSASVKDVLGYAPTDFSADADRMAARIFGDADHDRVRLGTRARNRHRAWSWSGPAWHRSGKALRVQVTAVPVEGPDGALAWNILILEVTGRHGIEAVLEESRTRLLETARQVPGETFRRVLKADGTLHCTYLIGHDSDRSGYRAADLERDAARFENTVRPDDRERRRRAILDSAEKGTRYDIEYRVIGPGKGVKWCRSVADPQRRENGGVVWNGVVLDVTERKQAQDALRRIEQLVHVAIGAIPHPVWAKDMDGRFLLFDAAAERYFGISAKTALGRTDHAVFSPETAEQILASDRAALGSAGPAVYERDVTLPRGRLRYQVT